MAEPSPRRRRLLWAGAALVATLAVLHSAAWWWTLRQIEAGIPGAIAAARSYGWELSTDPPRPGGWPLAARVTLGHVVGIRPLGAATLQLRLESADIEVDPADLRAVHLLPHGTQTIVLGDDPPITLRTARTVLRLPFDAGPIALTMDHAAIAGPDGRGAALARLDATFGDPGVSAAAEGVNAVPPFPAPFESGGRLTLSASWTRPFPVAATPAASAASWQAEGGRIAVPRTTLDWGPLHLDAHGEGGLDAALQPEVTSEIMVSGLPDLLDAAAKSGVLPPSVSQATRAVVTLLLRPAGAGPARLPVSVAKGTLTVARFPLLRLPLLEWGPR